MIRMNSVLLLVAAATLLTSSAYAQFPPGPETRTVNIKVTFGDLDLDNPSDARILFSRLEKAAKRACGPKVLSPSLYATVPTAFDHDYKACIARAIDDVVTRLNAPLVSRVYAETRQIKSSEVAKR